MTGGTQTSRSGAAAGRLATPVGHTNRSESVELLTSQSPNLRPAHDEVAGGRRYRGRKAIEYGQHISVVLL